MASATSQPCELAFAGAAQVARDPCSGCSCAPPSSCAGGGGAVDGWSAPGAWSAASEPAAQSAAEGTRTGCTAATPSAIRPTLAGPCPPSSSPASGTPPGSPRSMGSMLAAKAPEHLFTNSAIRGQGMRAAGLDSPPCRQATAWLHGPLPSWQAAAGKPGAAREREYGRAHSLRR